MKGKWIAFLLAVLTTGGLTFAQTGTKQPAASPLEEELQKLREAGIQTTMQEFAPPLIPDSENAALVYQKVFDLMDKNKEDIQDKFRDLHSYSDIARWTEEQKEEMSLFIEKNKEIYELLEKATSMSKCRFPINYEKLPDLNLFHLSKLTTCACLLSVRATVEAKKENIEKSLNTCLANLKLAKSLSYEPLLISQIVRIRILEEKIILPSIENILNKGSVSLELYKKLLETIAEERECDITHLVLKGTACGIIECFDRFRKNPAEVVSFFFPDNEQEKLRLEKVVEKYLPFSETDEIFCLRTLEEMLILSKQPYCEIRQRLATMERDIQYILPEDKNLITKISLSYPYFHFYVLEARLDALLGAAEIGIANRIYRQEHGEFVDSLSQLTPDILPVLPLDPFTGKDYIYGKKNKGFIVYSVGHNMKDDGGIPQLSEEGRKSGNFDIVWEDKGLEGRYQKTNSAETSEAKNTNKMQNEALRQLIEALNTNYSKIKDISVEYKTETINKGMEKPLHEGSYKWFKKGEKQRIEYFWGPKKNYYTIKIFTGEKIIVVSQSPNRPREITFMGEDKKDLGERNHAFHTLHYNETAPSGFLFNIHDESIPDVLQKYATEMEIQGKYANVVLEIPNRDQKFKLKIDIEKGIPLSIHKINQRGSFSEFVVTEPMEHDGIWFMKKGVLHRYSWHKKDSGELYSKNEQDAFVEIEKTEFNTGISDSLFNIIPQKDDEAYVIRQGIPMSYFLTEEEKAEVVKRVSEKRRKIESLYGKPAPELEIKKWINHEPDVKGKTRLYVFVNQVSGDWWLGKFNKSYKVLRDLIEVVVICRSENTEDLEKLIADNEIMFPVGVDKEGATFKKYFITSSMDGYTIDEKGIVVHRGLSQFLGNHVSVPESLEKAYIESLK